MAVPLWQPGTLYQPGDIVQPITAPAPTAAQVENGDFSAGNVNWDFTGGAEFVTTGGYSGNGACVRMPGSVPEGLALNKTPLVVPSTGSTFEASAMIQQGASIAGATRGWVEVRWYDSGGLLLSSERGNVVSDGSNGAWHQSKVTATRPAGAAYARAGIALFSVADHTHHIFGDNLSVSGTFAGLPDGLVYRAVQDESGYSAANEPAWPPILGQQVIDNDVIWEAVASTRVTWEASPLYVSGTVEPAWPTEVGGFVRDGTIDWKTVSRRVEDPNCPNTKIVVIAASKVFAGDDDIVRYSATVNPLDWSSTDDAGYLPTGLQNYGSNPVAAMGLYRGNLVVFNSEAFQLWQVDEDPASMALIDALPLGSTEHRSIAPVSNDLFFASSQGVRSIGIAASSTNYQAGDVGMPIDPLVDAALRAGRSNDAIPLGLYHPAAGQYWLCFPDYPPAALSLAGDLPNGRVSDVGQYSYLATGGIKPYRFTVTAGSLPPGAQMSGSGVVTYNYVEAGTFSWEVTVVDSIGTAARIADSATIAPQPVFAALSTGTAILAGPDSSTFTTTIPTGVSGALVDSRGGKLFHIGSGVGVVSSDGGASFTPCTGIPSGAPAAVVYSDGVWFYFSYGVTTQLGYRSSNGVDFVPFALYPSARSSFCAIAVDRMIMVGSEGVIRRSLDGGKEWSTVNVAGLGIVRAIAGVDGTFVAVDGNLNRGTFRRSTDNGATWSGVPSPYPALTPASVACRGRLFVVMFTGGQTCYSEDAGATWLQGGSAGNSLNTIGPANELVTAGVFLAASSNLGPNPAVLAYSSADGKTWQPMFTGSSTSLLSSITPLRGGQ